MWSPIASWCAAIEAMNGARFVHDRLEALGRQVEIAEAQKVKGLAPLACETDRIDAWVLGSSHATVPKIWLPDPEVRGARERARWRLHLVRHRTTLKNRIHQTLVPSVSRARCQTYSARKDASFSASRASRPVGADCERQPHID